MSQPANFGVQTGPPAAPTDVATRINDSLNALKTNNMEVSAPAYATEGTSWLDSTSALRLMKHMDVGGSWLISLLLNGTLDVALPYMLYGPWIDAASSGTVDLGALGSNAIRVTGTTTVTSWGTVAAGVTKIVRAAAALPITHHATSMILLSGRSETMTAGDTKEFVSEGSGNWREVKRSQAPHRIIGIVPMTANGTYDPATNGALAAIFIGQGGGGGGHYGNSSAGQASCGGGGSAGCTGIKAVPALSGTYSVVIGPAGAAPDVTTSAGPTAGGDTTVTGTGIALTCPGGTIGGTTGTGTIEELALGGDKTAAATGADFSFPGEAGHYGLRLSGNLALGGRGGKSPFGSPGREVTGTSTADAGNGFGAGGSGGSSINGSDRNGAAGRAGVLYIVELGW